MEQCPTMIIANGNSGSPHKETRSIEHDMQTANISYESYCATFANKKRNSTGETSQQARVKKLRLKVYEVFSISIYSFNYRWYL